MVHQGLATTGNIPLPSGSGGLEMLPEPGELHGAGVAVERKKGLCEGGLHAGLAAL